MDSARRHGLHAAIILTLALSSLGQAACGSSRSAESSTDSASVAIATTAGGAITVPGRPIVGRAPSSPPGSGSATRQASSRGAAGFTVPRGDNSIPRFGQEADPSQRQLALTELAAYMHARAKGEWSKACDYLARPTRRQLEAFSKRSESASDGCGPVLAALINDHGTERVDTLTNGLAALRIEAKTAFALFYGPKVEKYVMPMQNEDAAWKMTQIAPLPYPLGAPTTAP